jgi:hypothetical protein
MAIQDDSGSPEAHPLFPASEDDDDDEIKLVSFITISRIENGKQYLAPRQRRADELRSLDQLHAEFGGGEYVLTAFHNGRISTRRKLNLPGKSKPMFDEGINSAEEQRAASQAAPQPALDPMMAMMGGQGGGIMPFLMFMMQQQDKAADRQMQLMIAMMQGGRESSAEEKANARAEMQANLERERIASEKQMMMMREMMLLAQAGKSGGGSEDFTKGVEFMRGFAVQQVEMAKAAASGNGENELGSLLETLGQAFQVAQAAGMFKGAGTGLPEGVTEAAEAATT